MADVFDKCVQFKEGWKVTGTTFFHDMNIDWYRDYDLFEHWGYKVLYGDSPIDNGGPLITDGSREWLQFSTNDYLGMSRHPALRRVAAEYVEQFGIGTPMGSRLLTGSTEVHSELDRRVATFKKTEAGLSFATGANAMIGAVSALTSKDEMTILEQFALQALCGAKISGYPRTGHSSTTIERLEHILKKADPKLRN
jgi:7-keto-8-aminopelargonate synthetase-like enzyme